MAKKNTKREKKEEEKVDKKRAKKEDKKAEEKPEEEADSKHDEEPEDKPEDNAEDKVEEKESAEKSDDKTEESGKEEEEKSTGKKGKKKAVPKSAPKVTKAAEKKAKKAAEPKDKKKPAPKKRAAPEPEQSSSDEEEEKDEWWKEAYLCGCEWDHYDKVYQEVDWKFENLEKAFAPDGIVGKSDMDVYVFGLTEPQLLNMKPSEDGSQTSHLVRSEHERIVQIPVYIVTLSPVPLPSTVGVKSVMMLQEQMKPMREYRMAWVPKEGEDAVGRPGKRQKMDSEKHQNIFLLKTLQRRSVLKTLTEDRKLKSNYCHPYIFLPHRQKPEDPSTTVNFFADVDNNSIPVEFDWEMDDLKEFTADLAKEYNLTDDKTIELKDLIKAEVKKVKEKIQKEVEQRKSELDAIPEDVKEKLKQTRILKFYPSNKFPTIDHIKSPYINRYFKNAHEVL